jgi:hypothetical protein
VSLHGFSYLATKNTARITAAQNVTHAKITIMNGQFTRLLIFADSRLNRITGRKHARTWFRSFMVPSLIYYSSFHPANRVNSSRVWLSTIGLIQDSQNFLDGRTQMVLFSFFMSVMRSPFCIHQDTSSHKNSPHNFIVSHSLCGLNRTFLRAISAATLVFERRTSRLLSWDKTDFP